MRRGSRRGLALGVALQRLGRAADRHPVGAVLVLCIAFAALGQPVLAAIVALAVVLLAPPSSRDPGPWRVRFRSWRRRR